jgi:hypothetical protein
VGPIIRGLSNESILSQLENPVDWAPIFDVRGTPLIDIDRHSSLRSASTSISSSGTMSSISFQGTRLTLPSTLSTAPLSEISTSTLDLALIRQWDCRHGGLATPLLDLISDELAFRSTLTAEPDRHIRRSRGLLSQAQQLDDWGIATEVAASAVFMKAFTVPKADGGSRWILDATPINRISTPAPEMGLPRLHDIFIELSRFKFAATIDAKSYFYQFNVAKDIQRYFSFIVNGKRGKGLRRSMTRLCMGWRFSPAIAQRTSNVICAEVLSRLPFRAMCVAWVDNFIMAASTAAELETLQRTFLQVATEVNLAVHPFSPDPQRLTLLGFEVDMRSGSIRHTDKWLAKVQSQLDASEWTLHSAVEVLGKFMWITYARQLPLCQFPCVLASLSTIASTVASHGDWNLVFPMESALMDELRRALSIACTPFQASTSQPSDKALLLFSDASAHMWAYTSGSFAANGHFAVWPQAHIYFHELRAALAALLDAAATGVSHVALGVDNTAVLYALRSQHSPNSIANLWIRRALESLPSSFAFRVFHVASELNPADEYTRGSRGHHGSLAFLG